MRFLIFSLTLLFASGCGAPTPYQKYLDSKRSDCELSCEKAHSDKDRDGRRLCVRACEAKKDLPQT